MKKALIICAGGMSSSLIAKKTTEFLQKQGADIEIDATSVTQANGMILKSDFDLFLISPQTKMYLEKFIKLGKQVNKTVIEIPFQAYIPTPAGIEKMGALVKNNI